MAAYYSCADTAKLVRQALREAFPGIKFSVRSSTYAGGASIRVRWTDGPTAAQVDKVAGTFSGAYFDGMTDYKGSTYALFRGERVRFGADFIFCERDASDALVERAIAAVFARGWAALADVARPTAEDWRRGRCNGVIWGHIRPGEDLRDMIWQALAARTDRFPLASPLVNSVIYLGNDGCSQVGALAEVA